MFSCEFCKIFNNTFFYRTPQVAASEKSQQFTMTVLKSLQKLLAINYITYFPCFKKIHKYFNFLWKPVNYFLLTKTSKFYFMFTLLRFFGISFWIVLNLFLIYSGQWINFDNYTVTQMTTWSIQTQTNSNEIVFQIKMKLKWNRPSS